MAKTKEISTLETISANSAYILGKSKEGKIGFINNVFNEQGKLAEVPDHTTFATKTDLDQYVKIQIKDGKNVAYMNNESNGGLIKFTKADGTMSKFTLFDASDPDKTMLQIIVKDGKTDKVAKINGNVDGLYYIKTATNTPVADNELATLGDLVQFSPAQITGVSEGDVATCHNSADGGSLKYESATHTAFIGVNCDANSKEMLAEFALTEKKNGATLKSGNRLLAKKEGIFYTKGTDLDTNPEDEIVTVADLNKKVTKELDGTNNGDKAKIQNQNNGGVMQYVKQDGSNYAITVNDGTQNVCVELCALASGGSGSRLVLNTTGGYFNVGNSISVTDDDKILTKKDLKTIEQEVKEITTVNDLVEAAQDDITELETKINELTKKIEALESRANTLEADSKSLQTSMTDAVEKVNTYTANVSELLKQST